ncbi:hypothetical protein ACH5RR_039382 [Cinchona calisaya]|uniref:Reverse transcriptase zinc-binding domain-containing protein n=1 Tax=Cinchona calisaya TaxID=153742 RepID=A0ABD2Y1J7_9GENT
MNAPHERDSRRKYVTNICVAEACSGQNGNEDLIIFAYPNFSKELLAGKSACLSLGKDCKVWKDTSTSDFTVFSAVDLIRLHYAHLISRKMIWNRRIPLKLSIFIWRMLNKALPMDGQLKRMGIPIDSRCAFCNSEESYQHFFMDCSLAMEVWGHFE